ncbi:MAG: acyl-CoA carboxylase subunit epsilon [Cellulomonas sp.]
MNGSEPTSDGRASVRVVRGAPDEAELAALVAGIVAASARSDDDDEPASRSMWSDPARAIGTDPMSAAPGPDTWRWSLRG